MRKTKGLHLTLPMELYEFVSKRASEQFKSKAAYLKSLIAKDMQK